MEYLMLAKLYSEIESTTKRLEKTYIISEFMKKTAPEELGRFCLLVQGRVFPAWDEKNIGVASKLIAKAIASSAGVGIETVDSEWKKTGDIGETAKNLIAKRKQATLFYSRLTVKKVFENILRVSSIEGQGSFEQKISLVKELLSSAEPDEAKYIVRTVLEDLRVGVGDSSMRDAIVWAYFGKDIGLKFDKEKCSIDFDDNEKGREIYNSYVQAVQSAYDVSNDFGAVAVVAKESGLEGLKHISMKVGKPLKVMLYPKAKGIEDAFSVVGAPAAFEYKYDGFRMQVHKNNGKVRIFTRRLEDVTPQFPEIAGYIEKNVSAKSFILDCEAVGYDMKTGKYKPFQEISQRIKRKHNIEKLAKELPVELNVFDIMSLEGKSLIDEPFLARRKTLNKLITEQPKKIVVAKQIITSDPKEAEKFYAESLAKGNEGLMAKGLESVYKPGSRVGYGVKIKPTMESLDLVVVGAEWGTGKRGGWLSSFTLACIDDKGNFLEIGKVGTGIKEKSEGASFEQITELLKPMIKSEKGREVTVIPSLVLEISYEEIQKSPTYSSGYALRFPRVLRIREDRSPNEIASLSEVEDFYYDQKKR